MSLSTLLEAAKYLDYLDSNKNGGSGLRQQNHQQSQLQFQSVPIAQPSNARKSTRRQRSSRKDAANTMVAMSLPVSTGPVQMQHGVSIPLASGSHSDDRHHQAASLSSSFTTGSPLSSFASTALLCSKISSAASASSSTASSLSSSDSSSSCGEILMGDNDFNQSTSSTSGNVKSESNGQYQILTQQQLKYKFDQPTMVHKFTNNNNDHHDSGQSFARYIAATPTGPQLVTMSTSSTGITSASAPIDGRIRAGHVIQAATNNVSAHMGATGTSFDSRHYSIATTSGLQRGDVCSQAFNLTTTMANSLGNDSHLSGGAAHGSCPPMIMASVQPMILNTISPSAHQSIMAFQPATASSPTSSSSSYSRHRELHKTLEKNRRAHLRHCFELLKAELPASECVDKKTSHINIIKSAIRYVLALRQQECEIENELQRLTKIKFELAERLSRIRNEAQVDHNQLQTQQHTISMTQQSSSTISPTSAVVGGSPRMEQEHSPLPQQHQQPAAEQQLSFLLSRSKIDWLRI